MINDWNIIELDANGEALQPEVVLSQRSEKKLGVITNALNYMMARHLTSPDEISFDVYKTADGHKCELWADLRDFKFIYLPYYDKWFEIHVSLNEGIGISKHVEGISACEAELSQLLLDEVEINTEGDIELKENGTVFYNPDNPKESLLNRMLADKAPHYSIYHVDGSLRNISRMYSWSGTSIYDALMEVAEETECLFLFGEHDEPDGRLHRTISAYDLKDVCLTCGHRGMSNGVCPKCGGTTYIEGFGIDTEIFVSRENLTDEIDYDTNKDEIKNCFKLVAADDHMTAKIQDFNPSGTQYIWRFSEDMLSDMSDELREALENHAKENDEYTNTHEFTIDSATASKYNALVTKYTDENNEFKKWDQPTSGFSTLMETYHYAETLRDYLQTSMMPGAYTSKDTTAEIEARNLTAANLSPIGIGSNERLDMSASLANSRVLETAKAFIDTSRYRVSIVDNQSVYTSPTWRGKIRVESYTDDDDYEITGQIAITFNQNQQSYLKRLLEQTMTYNAKNKVGIMELIKKSNADFANELKRYSLDELAILDSVIKSCLGVLTTNDVGNRTHPLYNDLYVPYYGKQTYITNESKTRENEIKTIDDEESGKGFLQLLDKIKDEVNEALNMDNYLTDAQKIELASFRRDDIYQNENFSSDGLTEAEIAEKAIAFLDRAYEELEKASEIQHTITSTLFNLLLLLKNKNGLDADPALATIDARYIMAYVTSEDYIKVYNPLFAPLLKNFELGNWIHLQVDDMFFKLRLTDYEIDFNDLTKLSVTFADAVKQGGFVSRTTDILKTAAAISTSYNFTARQAASGEEANKEWLDVNRNGFALNSRRIVNSSDDETLVMDTNGMLMRKKMDFSDEYDPEQVRIINKGLYYTNDNWESVGTGIGSFTYIDPETGEEVNDFGVIAKTIIGKLILGENLGIYSSSGTMKINEDGFILTSSTDGSGNNVFTVQKDNGDGTYDKYIYVNDTGEVIIDGNSVRVGHDDEAPQTIQEYIDDNLVPGEAGADGDDGESPITVTIESTAGNIFKNKNISTILTCIVKDGNRDITDTVESFTWIRKDQNGVIDQSWTRTMSGNTISINSDDVIGKSVFECEVTLPDDGEEEYEEQESNDPLA